MIGAQKAGTTSLHSYLAEHPQVNMSSIKDPHFFGRPEDGPYSHRIERLEDYLALFSPSVAVRGESSPTYTMYPHFKEVPERIADQVPEAKFIYLVRDPIDRIISAYMHKRAVGGLRRTLEDDIGDLEDPVNNRYVCPSLYAMQLERYLRIFAKERILVVDQADLRASRVACLTKIFSFLDVRSDFRSPLFDDVRGASRDRREYPSWYAPLLNRRAPLMARWLPRNLRRSGRRLFERTLWPALDSPPLGGPLRQRLQLIVAGDVARLRQITGLSFETWSV